MGYETIVLASIALIFALIIMWTTSINMIIKRDIMGFLPFFSMSFALVILATSILAELFLQSGWAIIESLILLNFIWIFLVIKRGIYKND
jgi:hypothetical protein